MRLRPKFIIFASQIYLPSESAIVYQVRLDTATQPEYSRFKSGTLNFAAQTPATSYHSFRKIPPSGPVSFVPRPEIPISAHHPTGSMPSPEPSTAYGKISKFIGSMLQPWSIRDTSTVSSAAGPVIIRHPPPLDWVSTDTQDVVPLAPHVEEPVSLIAGDGSWSTLIGQFSQTPPESPSTRLPSAPNAPQSISATRSEDQWITYFAVDRYMRGRVKEPQGSFISSGVLSGAFSDVYKCDVRFSMPAETNPKMVSLLFRQWAAAALTYFVQ